ncbi:MAG: cupin domain-containing protein [Chloroflexi bacterium]|nr:cupin domain-containing protein [Chloroflexota bacterium]
MEQGKKRPVDTRLIAQASKLANLVDYREGSIVSRTIIDKKAGTVTLFAFAEGQGLSEHTAPYDALVYILDGDADIIISGKPIRLAADEMTIMPANEPHALTAVKNFKMMLVMIRS